MDKTPKPMRAIAIRQLKFARPKVDNDEKARAALASMLNSTELHQQPDLLHVEAVLVSQGINDNDDAFTHDELNKAISTPILKPMNWNHKDNQILGAMYAVEARDMEGNILAEVGDQPFELIIQGAVWHHLPHIKATAEQIVERIQKGDLFVSMECWFDSYNYGLYTQAGELFDLITRNGDTVFLDKHLRANGGNGKYNGMRIGRALEGINFGGVAFVDRPANKRSLILNQFTFDSDLLLQEVEASKEYVGVHRLGFLQTNNVVNDNMEVNMNDLNRAAANRDEIQDAVQSALEAVRKAEAAERVQADLATSQDRVAELENELKAAKQIVADLRSAIDHAFDGAKAAVANSTPEEIAAIDRALEVKGDGAGNAVFAAKIAWIAKSRAKAVDQLAQASTQPKTDEKLVKENADLKKELAGLKGEVRQAEIEYLFSDVLKMPEADVATFVKSGLAIETDEGYKTWLDEKKLFARKLIEANKSAQADDAEAGLLSPSDRETPVDDNGAVLRPELGRAPNDVRRVPRSKLTAAANLESLFEEVKEPNLAGASAPEGNGSSPMGKLVAGLLGDTRKKNEEN